MLSIFISSPANEFKEERIKIKKFIEENSILNQIFEVFVFEEDVVATGKQSDEIYLEKARNSDIYLGLIGEDIDTGRRCGPQSGATAGFWNKRGSFPCRFGILCRQVYSPEKVCRILCQ